MGNNAWNQDGLNLGFEQSTPRDRFSDAMERILRKALAVDDTDVFTLAIARQLFDKMLSDRPVSEQMEDKCALRVEKVGTTYQITLILMDKDENFVKKTTKSYYGYNFVANYIDETVVRYMDGQKLRIMQNPNR